MQRKSIAVRIRDLADTFGSIVATAAAVDNGRRPRDRDLRRIGIDPATFDGRERT